VRVHPPWWQQPWAVAAAVLLALAALQGLVRLRTRQLRARQRELEDSVQQRTAELQRLTKALQQESAALKESSLTDPLTGLRNRRFLVMQAADETSLAARRHEDADTSLGEPGAGPTPADADLVFFVIDLDHFKRINDEHGHAAGDAVLRGVAQRLGEVFRESDHLVRWGGEEFLAMARGTSREHADALAERIRSAVAAQPFAVPGGLPLRVTCSIGFACFPLSSRHPRLLDWGETVNLADAALYAAKASGRDAWVGLVDAGEIGDAAAGARRTTSEWLADPRVRIVRSRPARGGASAA
jgi:diguanylate cyclase (GGDEF)-like protein